MLPPTRPPEVTFSSIAFRKPYRYRFAYIGLILVVVIGITAAAVLSSMAPKSYNGVTPSAPFDIEVTPTTEQPVDLSIGHIYPIETTPFGFYITDGPDRIDYNCSITNANGEKVFSKEDWLTMPYQIEAKSGTTSYSEVYHFKVDLPPGRYTVAVDAAHPVSYTVTQNSKYEPVISGMVGMAVLGILLLIGMSIVVSRKSRELQAYHRIAAYSSPTYPAGYGVPAQTGYGAPQYPIYGSQQYPGYGAPPPPAYEDPNAVDYVCGKCGHMIQNPIIQGVITCERCGEKEYVQQ